MRMGYRAKYILVAGIALLVGGALGMTLSGWLLWSPVRFITDTGQVHILSQYAYSQFINAEYPHNKHALEEYSRFLDQYRVGKHSWMSQDMLSHEKVMTHARLAIIQEEEGEESLAKAHWAKALEASVNTHWKVRGIEHLRRFAQRPENP